MKKSVYILFMISTVFLLGACSSDTGTNDIEEPTDVEESNDPVDTETLIYLTIEELAEFDGKDGRDAYIAVSGKIYDVSNSSYWGNGNHNGYGAGQDLTEEILNVSPHGLSTLDGIPLIGEIVEEE